MMAADLEVPEVELDYEDGRAMLKAAEFGLPGHVGLVNVSKFHKLYGFGREKIYEQLEAYSCLSQKKGKKLLLTPTLSGFLRKFVITIFVKSDLRNEIYCQVQKYFKIQKISQI